MFSIPMVNTNAKQTTMIFLNIIEVPLTESKKQNKIKIDKYCCSILLNHYVACYPAIKLVRSKKFNVETCQPAMFPV